MPAIDDKVDVARLRRWIGKEMSTEETLTEALAARFHATLNLAGQPPREGERAPRLIHFCLAQPAVGPDLLSADGHVARGDFLPDIPLPHRMWASGELSFTGDLLVGQTIRRHSRVAEIELKKGRTGDLCFVAVDHRIEAEGALRVSERQMLVYRDASQPGGAALAVPAPDGLARETISPTPALLFRYSALTFNTHRIHYDRPYATKIEGYPGLVVQGPLQATLLFHFATRTSGGLPPDAFSFRGMSPAFDLDDLVLCAGKRDGRQRPLWTAHPDGPIAMQAEASWA